MIKSVLKSICLFFLKINNDKKMLHKNQLPGIMLLNGYQVLQLPLDTNFDNWSNPFLVSVLIVVTYNFLLPF